MYLHGVVHSTLMMQDQALCYPPEVFFFLSPFVMLYIESMPFRVDLQKIFFTVMKDKNKQRQFIEKGCF